MKNIGFILRLNTPEAQDVAAALVEVFKKRDVTSVFGGNPSEKPQVFEKSVKVEELAATVDVVLAIGGDGTFLAAARALYGSSVPLLGINLGHIGFLSEIDIHEAFDELADELLSNKLAVERRPFYTAQLLENGKALWAEPFFNDVVIQRNADEKMLQLQVDVDGEAMSESRADGLIIATPTGSTAYNLSTGGPIVHPRMDGLVLAPICPHKLSLRPIVIPPAEVEVRLQSDTAHISLDGRKALPMAQTQRLVVTPSGQHLRMLKGKGTNFFHLLRHKLGWDAAGSQRQATRPRKS